MGVLSLELPALYADHHVTAVRQLLLAMPGVEGVYASSSFHCVEVHFDESHLDPKLIEKTLADAGYRGDLPLPSEKGQPVNRAENGRLPYHRHSAAYAHVGPGVSFAQEVPYQGRALWPCPGIGALNAHEEVKDG